MGNVQSFLENLDSQHEKFTTGSITLESLINDIEFYESFIPEFFSKNGEAKGIRVMYESIRENIGNEKTIMCVDVHRSASIYREYMEGMVSFITEISNNMMTESAHELNDYAEKLERARTKDSLFIDSLYNGKLNEHIDTVLSEAVMNVEFLIDFIPQLNLMKESCKNLYTTVNYTAENKERTLIDSCMNMLFESVDNYCYSTVKNIVSTYKDIHEKLSETGTVTESEDISFKLF